MIFSMVRRVSRGMSKEIMVKMEIAKSVISVVLTSSRQPPRLGKDASTSISDQQHYLPGITTGSLMASVVLVVALYNA
jgi:hypothetical protein